ncbi:histone-lysine N-methyltransferase SETMAR-like protein [Tritrichomonas foetus]|uniref:Histone-lysine N-methyltransferase SETMAR-like protein n=5 Tax=Tritrichomonas foetus TaxID=1144522 RepID=A0A1J4JCB7_9EUKA|nr:histone-lysine N-methyltransferase SETMAR-like protein [Tritrichomonas foetus]OHS93242.1 histone-lysine N-methyltransferase SETMAR-like protein [Tritrichomonas foetus]OHS93279.1 histone-lysine N-methyltransferase SETMAR-like protein [Tritrichomonas foetus]OHS93381.1 histone-lysine N-methyltransferase SETMAR-like protein [Tritrichomonas foetus]OHS93641.1 histone-lysine N-methyltransferase SETMAR-like protein [Tritrichomonas foetus]|eukprot:OHS93101.1 histone-lysine N-methyltransferase SETMAR-like protein [Tritrichomonas foetus]
MIDQHSIITFLQLEGKRGKEIYEEMKSVLKEKCLSQRQIYRVMAELNRSQNTQPVKKEKKCQSYDILDWKILDVLTEFPHSSCRYIANVLGEPKSTIYDRLTSKLMYKHVHLRWVPHILTENQKANRVLLAKKLLKILNAEQKTNFTFLITGDESWFYSKTDFNTQWIPENSVIPTIQNPGFQITKFMVTVFWNPHGIIHIDVLPPNEKFNAAYYITAIMSKIVEFKNSNNYKKLFVHYDNAKPHVAKIVKKYINENSLESVPHPAYSPDLAPSDFFLFGTIKEKVKGIVFESPSHLIQTIVQIFNEIPSETLFSVFAEWQNRLKKVIDANGDYIF